MPIDFQKRKDDKRLIQRAKPTGVDTIRQPIYNIILQNMATNFHDADKSLTFTHQSTLD